MLGMNKTERDVPLGTMMLADTAMARWVPGVWGMVVERLQRF